MTKNACLGLALLAACGGSSKQSDGGSSDGSSAGTDMPLAPATCPASVPASEPALTNGVTFAHEEVTVGGIFVDRYIWQDSHGLVRSVALKKECTGNGGHGGYAVQMTYQVPANATVVTRTIQTDDSDDGGFGYFVSHEAYRAFDDGSTGTIAALHGEDDSALGKGFAVVGASTANTTDATHTFYQLYYRWGTKSPAPYDANSSSIPTPAAASAHVRYDLPVQIRWRFAAGTDAPAIQVEVDQTKIPMADLVFFDVRGPYGVLPFDEGNGSAVQGLFWGDRYFDFQNTSVPLTWASGGDWSTPSTTSRYHALVAGDYEMGLYEPAPLLESALADGYSDNRGKPAAMITCGDAPMLALPCPYEWPYQSLNYSLDETTPMTPTTGMKIAWGSAAFYGSSLPAISAGDGLTEPFDGRKAIVYQTCVVLAQPVVAQAADGASMISSATKAATARPASCASFAPTP